MRKIILLSLLFVIALAACKDDDDQSRNSYQGDSKIRVKRIVGENEVWGKYELEFNYRPDGRLEKVWRFDVTDRDTLGHFAVKYEAEDFTFSVVDYVLRIDADSIGTLKHRRSFQTLYSTRLEEGRWAKTVLRPRRNTGSGTMFDPSYINVFSQQIALEESAEGRPVVIRCYSDEYGDGGENNKYERTIAKYEFNYEGDDIVSAQIYKPDSYSVTSWTKLDEITFSFYSGILTGVDNAAYKMRRSSKKVVIAEPGKNITYTLNDEGLAIRIESTDGETATIEYENGSGNFSDLYATPLDKILGKVWVK
ncbi:MAG: hypothetical protein ACLTSL_14395 [Odoribacter splanchnicus]